VLLFALVLHICSCHSSDAAELLGGCGCGCGWGPGLAAPWMDFLTCWWTTRPATSEWQLQGCRLESDLVSDCCGHLDTVVIVIPYYICTAIFALFILHENSLRRSQLGTESIINRILRTQTFSRVGVSPKFFPSFPFCRFRFLCVSRLLFFLYNFVLFFFYVLLLPTSRKMVEIHVL